MTVISWIEAQSLSKRLKKEKYKNEKKKKIMMKILDDDYDGGDGMTMITTIIVPFFKQPLLAYRCIHKKGQDQTAIFGNNIKGRTRFT